MVIQVLANLKEEGYLEKGRHPTVAPFLAGANVAFRRQALEQVGGFDPKCATGEDCDICARLSGAGYELYMRRGAIVRHRNPSTLRRLIRQWFGYGFYHPYVFSKHNERALELHVRAPSPVAGERFICLFYRRFPVGIVVFLTTFLAMHVALLVSLALLAVGWQLPSYVGLGLTGALALAYFWHDLKRHGPLLGWVMIPIRYVADMALFVGAFIGGLKQRMLYLSATVD